MKILHTSDWHVGRTIRGRSRADEHRAVLDEIVAIAHAEEVDLVLVAGDQFDTAAPSPEAEAIVYGALLDLAASGAQVVVITGNHDHPRRWGAIRPLLDLTNVHAASLVQPPDRGGVIDVKTQSGETARIALLPWVSQRGIVTAADLMARDADQHAASYADKVRGMLAALSRDFGGDTVNLMLAHLTVANGAPGVGGGERTPHILDYVVPPQAFPPTAHYVALGHLHQPHQVPGPCPIWYSGSPLALDFGEVETDHKAVLLVEATPSTPAQVRRFDLTAGRHLRTVRGTLDEVLARAPEFTSDHVRVILDEPQRVGLADEVRDAMPSAVDVTIARRDSDDAAVEDVPDLSTLRNSPTDLFAEYLRERDIEDPALAALFADLLDQDDDHTAAP